MVKHPYCSWDDLESSNRNKHFNAWMFRVPGIFHQKWVFFSSKLHEFLRTWTVVRLKIHQCGGGRNGMGKFIASGRCFFGVWITPPKTDISSKKCCLENDFPFEMVPILWWNANFSGSVHQKVLLQVDSSFHVCFLMFSSCEADVIFSAQIQRLAFYRLWRECGAATLPPINHGSENMGPSK